MNTDKITNILHYMAGMHKSIYVNFSVLPFKDAIKLPIIVSRKTKLSSLSGRVILDKNKTGIIRIGFGNVRLVDFAYERTIFHLEGTIHFRGKCKIGKASKIEVGTDGYLDIGENFTISAKSKIICHKSVKIGKNSTFAWDSLIMDTDYHDIYNASKECINEDKEILIGEKVWIGTRSTILKGSVIPDNCIVAANSLLAKIYNQEHCIVAGNPAKVVKKNVFW
jgi:acetyltransferase-like isoleucine patch superfamily enzyme